MVSLALVATLARDLMTSVKRYHSEYQFVREVVAGGTRSTQNRVGVSFYRGHDLPCCLALLLARSLADNDDGSAYYNTHHNYFAYAGTGMKNDFNGPLSPFAFSSFHDPG